MTLAAAGTLLGALFGLAHAVYVFGVVASNGNTTAATQQTTAIYAAAWTLLLWLLFATWLLLFWLLGSVLYLSRNWWR
jgi:hypothetical protein